MQVKRILCTEIKNVICSDPWRRGHYAFSKRWGNISHRREVMPQKKGISYLLRKPQNSQNWTYLYWGFFAFNSRHLSSNRSSMFVFVSAPHKLICHIRFQALLFFVDLRKSLKTWHWMAKTWLLVSNHSEHEMIILGCLCKTAACDADVSVKNIAVIWNHQSRHA
jgi:hypothetical protein